MDFNTKNCHTTRVIRSALAAALSDAECALHRVTPDICAKSGLHETVLTEPVVTAGEEAAPSFMERVLELHTVTCAAEDMAATVVESGSDDTQHKPQPPSKTVVMSSPDTRSEMEHALADAGFMTNADVEAIVEIRLTKWTSTPQSQIVEAVESTFEEALQARCFNSNNVLKAAMFRVVEQALGKVVRSGRAPAVSGAEM